MNPILKLIYESGNSLANYSNELESELHCIHELILKCRSQDLNQGPSDMEDSALTTRLRDWQNWYAVIQLMSNKKNKN